MFGLNIAVLSFLKVFWADNCCITIYDSSTQYKLRQQCYYNLRQPGYYSSRQLLLHFTTGITIYDIITIHDCLVLMSTES